MYKTEKGGLIPVQLSEHHVECFDTVIREALKESKKSLDDIQLIAFSQGPGIGHALRIGSSVARALSILLKVPLIGVNHCVAHLEIASLYNAKDPVLLYASGANTQVIAYDGGKYRVFGETLDIGVGNFLDSFGRDLGLGFPAGPKIDLMAQKAKARNAKYIELPYNVKGMDVSFSGLHTILRNKIKNERLSEEQIEDLCYSVEETVFAMLLEVSERAMAHCEKNELVLGGGVACNTRLKEMAIQMCKDRKAKCIIPDNQFLVDNAAMIAVLGIKMFNAGNITKIESSQINPYERTDDIEVNWK
jgi:N6-L-threonylcarbamoyladenine synthase